MPRAVFMLCFFLVACGTEEIRQAPTTDNPPQNSCAYPWTRGDPVRVGQAGTNDTLSTAAIEGDGKLLILYDTSDVDFINARIMRSQMTSATSFEMPQAVALGAEPLMVSPSFVEANGNTMLYFAASSSVRGAARVYRTTLSADGSFTPRVEVTVPSGLASVLSWPRFYGLPDGRVALAYRDWASEPQLALSSDGLVFESTTAAPDATGLAMPNVCSFADGTLVFTHQTGGTPMIAKFQISGDDGNTWTASQPITTASSNVHDTTCITREDGAVDLYYIYPVDAFGFSILRRSLAKDGTLGPEERLTFANGGDASKPHVFRAPGCGLLLTYAEITERSVTQGYPTQQRLGALLLETDAPPPPSP